MGLRFSLSLIPSRHVKRTEPCQSFGWLWQEAVRDIGALVIHLHENHFMSRVATVIREEFEDKGLTLPANCQVFQLLPGEFITKLDAYDSDGAFVAVRFHTNMRVSQIFGSNQGKKKSIVAPPGQYIHHPTGTFRGKHCVAIGALFTPLGRSSTLVARSIPSDQLVYSAIPQSKTTSGTFVELRNKLKAVVITTNQDDRIIYVRVVSPSEYKEYLELQAHFDCKVGWRDHWIEMVKDEHLTTVEVRHDASRVHSLCFKTNLRTTPWLGRCPGSPMTTTTLEPPTNASICGFHGHYAKGMTISALGLISKLSDTEKKLKTV